MKRRRELISVWEDVGAYLRGEEKEGAYLSVGGRGSLFQGWRCVEGVYMIGLQRRGSISQGCREGGSLSQCGRTWEHNSGMETCRGSIL